MCFLIINILAIDACQLWSLERQIFHSIMVNTAKSKFREKLNHMKNSRRLQQMFNEEQLKNLADTSTEEHVDFRTEIDGNQTVGKIYLIVSGKVIKNCHRYKPAIHQINVFTAYSVRLFISVMHDDLQTPFKSISALMTLDELNSRAGLDKLDCRQTRSLLAIKSNSNFFDSSFPSAFIFRKFV